MRDVNNISSVYFLGIGGIGMSALARYFNSRGVKVSGYDKTPSPLTDQLIAEGMAIHFEDDPAKADLNAELVIFTPALPADHAEMNTFKTAGIEIFKRSDVLSAITNLHFSICVAGTHGKTTTSAMIAHILRHSGHGSNAFLGGIAANYDTNFWSDPNMTAVAEADEYDRSFLKLTPDVAVITAMDADHLDIYGTEENMQEAFISFGDKIKAGGTLFMKKGIARENDFTVDRIYSYSVNDTTAHVHATELRSENGAWRFDVQTPWKKIENVTLAMGGLHNAENAIVAIAVAVLLKINEDKIRAATEAFRGVKRRFEYIIPSGKTVMIDDYAHHPEELRALISGAKEMFPGRRCTVVFQPHLFTRTRDLASGFAEVLALADQTVLLPIYPARELPIAGITSEMISKEIPGAKAIVLQKDQLKDWLTNNPSELLITAGAGDIDALVEPIKNMVA